MATIDRIKLLGDMLNWLPEDNILTTDNMNEAIELVIAKVGDDDTKYGEVFCKTLDLIADWNIIKTPIVNQRISRESLGDHSVSYDSGMSYRQVWTDFKEKLNDVCPLYGYSPSSRKSGIRINPGTPYNPLEN